MCRNSEATAKSDERAVRAMFAIGATLIELQTELNEQYEAGELCKKQFTFTTKYITRLLETSGELAYLKRVSLLFQGHEPPEHQLATEIEDLLTTTERLITREQVREGFPW